MSKKIDERLPQQTGKGLLPDCPVMKTPWDKAISYKESIHYISRYFSVLSSAIMQAYRILIPDYALRSKIMCEDAYARLYYTTGMNGKDATMNEINVHPFMRGGFCGALSGDSGDECYLMCGRVNDFGTYRVEKELDVCDWDIIGTELCRATTMSLAAGAVCRQEMLRKGPSMDYCMVEARGAGDRHCRIVAESREKYPMPEHEIWQSFGPIATEDQIRNTQEEDTVKESMVFREDANYRYESGTHQLNYSQSTAGNRFVHAASLYLLPAIDAAIRAGVCTEEQVKHVLRCVLEAAGKAAWGDRVAIEAHRQWLGVPRDFSENDGRIMGAHVEMILQASGTQYTVEAFNKDEVILVFPTMMLNILNPRVVPCMLDFWYGECKTLVSPEWSLWAEPTESTPEGMCRIKIGKKIDKFC